jgi:hypothetical protein
VHAATWPARLTMLLDMSSISSRPAPNLAACLSIAQLLVKGGSLLEADRVVLVIVGSSDSDGLCFNLGMEQNDLARVAFNGARMGRELGCILVVDDVQFEGVPCADASGVGGDGVSVWHCVRPFGYAWCVECFWMGVASGACINRPMFCCRFKLSRYLFYSVLVINLVKPDTCVYICRIDVDIILFWLKMCTANTATVEMYYYYY